MVTKLLAVAKGRRTPCTEVLKRSDARELGGLLECTKAKTVAYGRRLARPQKLERRKRFRLLGTAVAE